MNYRKLGSTDIRVSEIGLGCEGLLNVSQEFTNEVFHLALSQGINCLDLYSPDPDMHKRVGSAIRTVREDFILQAHFCTAWQDNQYKCIREITEVKSAFNNMLKNLDTDYIDIGMIHYVDTLETWQSIADGEVMAFAKEMKEQSKIRHIGLSSHNPIVALEAVRSGLIEVLMFSVNPCYDLHPGDENLEKLWAEESYQKQLLNMDPHRQALYEACQTHGVGITVMKAFGGGDLLSENSPAGKALTVHQCIQYALDRPAVASVLVGSRSLDELKTSLAFVQATIAEKDYTKTLASFPKISWKGHCMYCGHCAPCPMGIEIASVTKFLNLSLAQGAVPETVREHYAALSHPASACIQCKACEKRCPFTVPVCENMAKAAEVFGY